jgi:hypothetical protein
MQRINKKGLSGVIAVAFTILVSFAVITLLFVYLSTSLNLSPEFASCAEMAIKTPVTFGEKVCYNKETGDIEVDIVRPISEINAELFSLDFNIISNERNFKQQCGPSCGGNCHILSSGKQTYYIPAELENPRTITIGANGCSAFDSREINIC